MLPWIWTRVLNNLAINWAFVTESRVQKDDRENKLPSFGIERNLQTKEAREEEQEEEEVELEICIKDVLLIITTFLCYSPCTSTAHHLHHEPNHYSESYVLWEARDRMIFGDSVINSDSWSSSSCVSAFNRRRIKCIALCRLHSFLLHFFVSLSLSS